MLPPWELFVSCARARNPSDIDIPPASRPATTRHARHARLGRSPLGTRLTPNLAEAGAPLTVGRAACCRAANLNRRRSEARSPKPLIGQPFLVSSGIHRPPLRRSGTVADGTSSPAAA